MSILLLAECWPYRNVKLNSFDTSQMRLLAQACNLTVDQLQQLCTCQYVIENYIPSCKRKKGYEIFLRATIDSGVIDNMIHHDITIMIGKRLMSVLSIPQPEFYKVCYHTTSRTELTIACIPNPMAEFYWKDTKNVEKVKAFMTHVFEVYE